MSRKVYELEPQAFEFTYLDKDYILREASEGAASRYKGARQKALRIANDKVAGFEASMSEANAVLIAGCCFRQTKQGEKLAETPVALHEVQAWPHRLTKELYEKCKELCPELEPKGGKTVAELQAEIAELQKELADVKAKTSDPKDAQSGGETTSS